MAMIAPPRCLPLYAGFYGSNVLESRLPRGGYNPVGLRKVPTALVVFWRSPRDNGPLRAARPPGFARAYHYAAATRFCGRYARVHRNAVEADLKSTPRALLTFAA